MSNADEVLGFKSAPSWIALIVSVGGLFAAGLLAFGDIRSDVTQAKKDIDNIQADIRGLHAFDNDLAIRLTRLEADQVTAAAGRARRDASIADLEKSIHNIELSTNNLAHLAAIVDSSIESTNVLKTAVAGQGERLNAQANRLNGLFDALMRLSDYVRPGAAPLPLPRSGPPIVPNDLGESKR